MPRGVYERTSEMNANMSRACLGRWKDSIYEKWKEEAVKLYNDSDYQKWVNEIKYKNQSEAAIRGAVGRSPVSDKTRENMSRGLLKAFTDRPEICERMSRAAVERYKDPEERERMCSIMSEVMNRPEVKERISRANLRVWANPEVYASRTRENHWNWKGGSVGVYGEGWRDIRYFILARDHFKCQECGELEENLCPHHIDYDKENMDDTNLITLCRSCNNRANFNREYWQEHFVEKIRDIYQIRSRSKGALS